MGRVRCVSPFQPRSFLQRRSTTSTPASTPVRPACWFPSIRDLESQTRAKAEQQLQQTALADGILDAARKNARATVTTLLYTLGFQQVDVS